MTVLAKTQSIGLNQLDNNQVGSILARVPILRNLKAANQDQFNELLMTCRQLEFTCGELVLQRGSIDNSLYFLLAGQLAVYHHHRDGRLPLNYIVPGEMFGDLALLDGTERRASVFVDDNCRKARVLAMDFSSFGNLNDFSRVKLATKLSFYHAIVHGIRWRLELKRMENRDHPLVDVVRRLPVFKGVKGSLAELGYLHDQAERLASLLTGWDGNGICDAEMLAVQPVSPGSVD
ncbi:MAG: cyclic nucleotide-binding domain-containing protein [Pseudomonadales bacterium]